MIILALSFVVSYLGKAHLQMARNQESRDILDRFRTFNQTWEPKFEQLEKIINGVDKPDRMAVCVDTCHIFAAGYDIRTEEKYEATFAEFDSIIGLQRLVAFHYNDSKKEFGSHRDRHEHIGKGMIGVAGFSLLMNDARFVNIPKILETPKSKDLHEDVENLKALKELIRN